MSNVIEEFENDLYPWDEEEPVLKPKTDPFLEFCNKVQTEAYKPVRTGLDFYDELMNGGANAQTLTVLLAEQGAGKSMLLQQLAECIATKERREVIYLNFEMSYEQLIARALSARVKERGNIEMSALDILRGYKWSEKQLNEVVMAEAKYQTESQPFISYNPEEVAPTVERLEDYLAELADRYRQDYTEPGKTAKPAPVLFVDYLQLIQGSKSQDVKDRLTQVLIDLKEYAIRGNTIVFLISAISRDKAAKKIQANRARDTSAIEYQADYILSLENYKEQHMANRKGLQRMKLEILKSRDGENGRYSLIYRDGKNNRFTGEYKGVEPEPNEEEETEEEDTMELSF